MAAVLVTLADFTGILGIAKSIVTNPELQNYIDTNEGAYIRKILGVELGNLFIADLANPSQADRFAALEDAFQVQDSCGHIYESRGLVFILTSMLYFDYVYDTQVRHSQSGTTKSDAETAKTSSTQGAFAKAAKRWNDALADIEAIQYRCTTELPATYPEFKGISITPQYSL